MNKLHYEMDDVINILKPLVEFEGSYVREQCEKFFQQTDILNRWLYLKNKGKSVAEYCKECNYKTIAIYGMANLGERLLEEIEETDVFVAYGIDRDPLASDLRDKIRIYDVCYELDDRIDAVFVTPILYYDEIKDILNKKVSCPIISLREVIWAL